MGTYCLWNAEAHARTAQPVQGDLVWDMSRVALLMSLKGFPEMKTHLRMHEEKSRRSFVGP